MGVGSAPSLPAQMAWNSALRSFSFFLPIRWKTFIAEWRFHDLYARSCSLISRGLHPARCLLHAEHWLSHAGVAYEEAFVRVPCCFGGLIFQKWLFSAGQSPPPAPSFVRHNSHRDPPSLRTETMETRVTRCCSYCTIRRFYVFTRPCLRSIPRSPLSSPVS